MGAGITLVRDSVVLEHLPSVTGLISERTAEEINACTARLKQCVRAAFPFAPGVAPFMTLSFMALAVIPELKLTDRGVFDVSSLMLSR